MKQLYDYKDQYGLICTKSNGQFDGGDTLANEFTVIYALQHTRNKPEYDRQVALLQPISGQWIRHCDATKWYSNPECTSRDQLTPVLAFLACTPSAKNLFYSLVKKLATRGFLFAFNCRRNFQYPTLELHQQRSTPDVIWNYGWKMPDILGPDIWAIIARGILQHTRGSVKQILFSTLLRPIIWLGDLQLLGAAIISQYKFRFKVHLGVGRQGIDHDDRNQAIKTHFAKTYTATYLSKLSSMVYGTARPLFCFKSFWSPDAEPPIDKFISLLYGQEYEEN